MSPFDLGENRFEIGGGVFEELGELSGFFDCKTIRRHGDADAVMNLAVNVHGRGDALDRIGHFASVVSDALLAHDLQIFP